MTAAAPHRALPTNDPYVVVTSVANALPAGYTVESVGGQVVALPRPKEPHVVAATNLGEELGPPFKRGRGGPGGWVLLDEAECHLADDREYVVPDLVGWRRAGLPGGSLPTCDHGYVNQPPDWVCEVLSPGQANQDRDRVTKLALYERVGVRHYWLVDPEARTLEVLRLDGTRCRLVSLTEGDKRVCAEPFDAIELDLAILWTR